jgi:hypothetical protein
LVGPGVPTGGTGGTAAAGTPEWGCSLGLPPWGRPFRVCVPYDPSACSAVITATSAKSWTEQPRETSFAGLLRPWKIGPIALAPPRRSVIL